MADEFDEYEKLLEGNANGDAGAEPSQPADPSAEKERSSRRDGEGKRERRDRSRSRERKRDRGKERDNDFRTDRRGSRSRSRDRRHREERDRRDRDRGRDRGGARDRFRDAGRGRGRDRDRFPPRRRSPTPPDVRAAREREREFAELERATRTVFAFNINIKADERDIFTFFSKAGQVTDIRLITDRHTKKSKGLAYVEFSKQEEVFLALTLTGQPMLGQPVMVKPAEAEKNLAWEAAQAAKQAAPVDADLIALGLGSAALPAPTAAPVAPLVPQGPLRLQVSGFKQGLGEGELRQIFEPFGPLDSVSVVRDAAGNPMSIAYVVFRNGVDGSNAMTHWHGQSLLDNVLTVTATALDAGMGGPGPAVGVGELDDDDGGLKIDAQKRAALMSRLASSAGITQPAAAAAMPGTAPFTLPALASHPGAAAAGLGIMPGGLLAPGAGLPGVLGAAAAGLPGVMGAAAAVPGLLNPGGDLSLQQGLLGPASPIPTQCLLLKNMFEPASQQTEQNWVEEVAEDVRDECSKFGGVLHIHVDKASQGFVYLKFDGPAAAQAAKQVLHGRFYNGHRIEAEFQFVQIYNQFFGLQ